jgi:D-glycero-D-manno-heptose 1,7-bisphosphate phosphatase
MDSLKKALFLDRDGTLIIDKVYLSDPAKVELIDGTRQALDHALKRGYLLFLFTNQSGIGRGLHTLEDTHRVNKRMEELIALKSPLFTEICIAPEGPNDPIVYRKPSPRFILESIKKYNLDTKHSWMVGDSEADIKAAHHSQINSAAVKTGKIDPTALPYITEKKVPIFNNLADFVNRTL